MLLNLNSRCFDGSFSKRRRKLNLTQHFSDIWIENWDVYRRNSLI